MSVFGSIAQVVGSIGAGALSAQGEVEANKDDAQTRADLEAGYALAQAFEAPIRRGLSQGLAPAGFLRDALAAEDDAKALGKGYDAARSGRALGSRQSAKGADMLGDAASRELLDRAQTRARVNARADETLAGMALDDLGYFNALFKSPARNDKEVYSRALNQFLRYSR